MSRSIHVMSVSPDGFVRVGDELHAAFDEEARDHRPTADADPPATRAMRDEARTWSYGTVGPHG